MADTKFSEDSFDKAAAALDKIRITHKPAVVQWLEKHIAKIDQLQNEGASLRNIFTTVNNIVQLGVSYATFQRYVQTVRKTTGSEFYKPKATEKEKSLTAAWACGECRNATKQKSGKKIFYECPACHTAYAADDAGAITPDRFTG